MFVVVEVYQRVQLRRLEEPGRWKWRITQGRGPRANIWEGTLTVDENGCVSAEDPGHITAACALLFACRHGPVDHVDHVIDVPGEQRTRAEAERAAG